MSGMGEGCGERRLLWREGGDDRGRNDVMSSMFGGGNYMTECDEGERVAWMLFGRGIYISWRSSTYCLS